MSIAYDYAYGPIAPAALKSAGVGLVLRYVSTPGNSKNITASEYKTLTGAGIQVALVYETTATWMLGGYNAGMAAAKAARAQATAAGYPTWQRIWYAADWDVSAAQVPTVLDALHGAADAEGSKSRVAVYGGYAACLAAVGAGFAAPWQTVAWSGGKWVSGAALRQTGKQATVGGAQVDVNQITGTVLLAAPTQSTPAVEPVSPEEDEMSTTSNAGRAGISWPAGSRHVVQVTYDPAQGNPKLRVVLALTTGPWVAPSPWVLAKGNGTYEIPAQLRANCRGVILEGAATGEPVYDACAA